MSPAASRSSFAGTPAESLEAAAAALRSAPVGDSKFEDRLATFDALADAIVSAEGASLPIDGLAFLSGFLRRDNLRKLVQREIQWPLALDRFVAIDGRKSLRLVPRGLACHWVAGNVPLLGVLSWSLSALVGNRNLVRTSTRQEDFLTPVLRVLKTVSPIGAEMASGTIVVSFDREDQECHQRMSRAADVRIAWGGDEAVDAIRSLPRSWECEDVVFGPRNSIAVVDPAVMTPRMIQRLAVDAVFFDQLACSSPQRLFVRGSPGEKSFDQFVQDFVGQFQKQSGAHARHKLDFGETYQIALDRTRALMRGSTIWRDAGTQWTVSLVDSPQRDVVCANRYIEIIGVKNLKEVEQHVPANAQTVTQALNDSDLGDFSEAMASKGVCRLPRPGEANNFENPWDGIAIMSRLMKWVLRTDPK